MAIQLNTNPVFLDPELAEILEYQRNINIGGGTNLAGQGGGGLLNRLRNQVQETDPYAYGSYVIPASDPTYSSGFNYARTIAGGMPFEDVVAPGMSFSPDQPMGYTQADLRREQIYGDFNGVMPTAPTKGTPVEASYETMPDAPVGTPAPERYVPGQTPFPGIPDFLKDLDFSNLPGVQEPSEPQFGSSAPAGFIPPPPGSFNTMAFVDYYNPTTGETWSAPSGGWTAPEGWVIGRPDGGLRFAFDEVDPSVVPTMPTAPAIQQPITPVVQEPTIPQVPVMPQVPAFEEPISFIPKLQNIPMNFTGLPQMPVIPNIPVMPKVPVMPQPIVPQPIPPMNFTGLSNLPVSNFVQPNVEDIVSPISRGRILPKTPRGLFTL
jgi:hypothetical protein